MSLLPNRNYRDYTIPLLAGVPRQLKVRGDYYQVISANGAITIKFDQGVSISREQSMGGPADYVDSVEITSPIDQTVVMSLGNTNGAAPYDGRGNFSAGTINVEVNASTALSSFADAAVGAGALLLIMPADATRRDAIICVDSTQAGPLRIGDSTVDGSHGVIVEPGSTLILSTTAAIYAWNSNAVAVTPTITATKA